MANKRSLDTSSMFRSMTGKSAEEVQEAKSETSEEVPAPVPVQKPELPAPKKKKAQPRSRAAGKRPRGIRETGRA